MEKSIHQRDREAAPTNRNRRERRFRRSPTRSEPQHQQHQQHQQHRHHQQKTATTTKRKPSISGFQGKIGVHVDVDNDGGGHRSASVLDTGNRRRRHQMGPLELIGSVALPPAIDPLPYPPLSRSSLIRAFRPAIFTGFYRVSLEGFYLTVVFLKVWHQLVTELMRFLKSFRFT